MHEAKYAELTNTTDLTLRRREILDNVGAVIDPDAGLIANCANAVSILYHTLGDINWCGFYMASVHQLVLGPFQGKPACTRISYGKGVCGHAASTMTTIVVDNVEEFEGHIACDANSRSEIVVPLSQSNVLIAVLDIDSPIPARFTRDDQLLLESVVQIITDRCL